MDVKRSLPRKDQKCGNFGIEKYQTVLPARSNRNPYHKKGLGLMQHSYMIHIFRGTVTIEIQDWRMRRWRSFHVSG